ncbi:hypothetical protein [Nitrosomonas ureae]|uniref:hypothetical protein n=1 Tax=Nitrosomonas ureae TaxID=44577 RepID=UPI000CDEAD75|nr:hypothetical protein [Nitrosomonas ureae]
MIRKSFFLILTLAVLCVPVFLMAHAFTHYAQADLVDVIDNDIDLDEICLDCLALTALNLFLIASGLLLCISVTRHRLPLWAIRWHSDSKTPSYYSRAPPSGFSVS